MSVHTSNELWFSRFIICVCVRRILTLFSKHIYNSSLPSATIDESDYWTNRRDSFVEHRISRSFASNRTILHPLQPSPTTPWDSEIQLSLPNTLKDYAYHTAQILRLLYSTVWLSSKKRVRLWKYLNLNTAPSWISRTHFKCIHLMFISGIWKSSRRHRKSLQTRIFFSLHILSSSNIP